MVPRGGEAEAGTMGSGETGRGADVALLGASPSEWGRKPADTRTTPKVGWMQQVPQNRTREGRWFGALERIGDASLYRRF